MSNHPSMNDNLETGKREWLAPTLQDWDIKEETQAGVLSHWDGSAYS